MSQRSTNSSGVEISGDGQFDGGPAETDPMGGNMGLSTPYIELLPPPEPPSEDWSFIPIDSDAPMYVNGQRVTCTLDGMAIGCSMAMGMLANGSAERDYGIATVWSNSQNRYVGFARWDSNAAAAGVGIGTGGMHGLNNNGQNTGWVWMGQSFSTQGGVGGVTMGGSWYSLGDYGHSNYYANTTGIMGTGSAFRGYGNDGPSISDEPKRKLTDAEKRTLKDKVSAMTSNEECLSKLNAVITQLGSKVKGGFTTYFENVLADKGGYKLRITKSPVLEGGSASALFGDITLNSKVAIEDHDVDTIHEMFHAVRRGNFTHMQIAEAIANVEGLSIQNLKNWYANNGGGDPGGLANSFVEQYCKGGSKNWAGWLERFK